MVDITNSPRNNFFSDKEVNLVQNDSIDFGWLAEALREIILTSQTPITVGVIGDWGAGKTSIMRMTEQLLEINNNAKTIWFNAWKYDRVYDLRIAFIQKILIDIKNDKTMQAQAKDIAADLIKRVDWLALAQSAASLYVSSSTGSIVNPVLQLIPNSIKQKKPEESIALIGEFDKRFQELIDVYAKDERVVVFIDDLDRCLPEKAISILESIKLFLDAEKCIFVIGINKKIIEKGVDLRYKQLPFDGADYMEKIIQIPFTLPELREEDAKNFIKKIAPKSIQDHSDIIAKIGGNPRRIKRLVNKFLLQITLAKYKPDLEVSNEIIAKLSVIELRWGKFYEDIIRYYDKNEKTSLLLNEMRDFKNKTEEQKNITIARIPKIEDYIKEIELEEFLNTEPTIWDVKIEPYIYLRNTTTPDFEESEKEHEEGSTSNVAGYREQNEQDSYQGSRSNEGQGVEKRLSQYHEMPKGEIGERRGRFFIVGIGGCGGNLTRSFLEIHDSSQIDKLMRFIGSNASEGLKGIWLEADKNDAYNNQKFFKPIIEGSYPAYVIPHDIIEYGSDLHIRVREKYGYDLKKQGFVRDAQYLKAIFEIFDVDKEIQNIAAEKIGEDGLNPIFDSAWKAIEPYTTFGFGDCDGILFIVSFGGGTGTGFINPIIDHIRRIGATDYPVFVLGILTEPGDFADRFQFAKEGRRNFAAISAIYDLLTMNYGAHGIILVDNQILLEHFEDYRAANKFIRKMMLPMVLGRDYPGETPPSQAIAHNISSGLARPPVFVPLYWSLPGNRNLEEDLVKMALENGRLFKCTPKKADFALVFCRGFIDSAKVREALSENIGLEKNRVWVIRKMGEGDTEILILLRNPYGSDPEAYLQKETLENKFCNIIDSALEYMNTNVEDLFYENTLGEWTREEENTTAKLMPLARKALEEYYFGDEGYLKNDIGKSGGLAFELKEARKRLMAGEKPFFYKPLRIFKKEVQMEDIFSKPGDIRDITLNAEEISRIIDLKVKEKLADLGVKMEDKA